MEITVEEKGAFDRVMTIRIEAGRVEKLLDQEVGRLAGAVRLPGFRPGKVPKKLLESRFKDHLTASVAEQLFKDSYPQAVVERALRPVDSPTLDLGELVRGQDFVMTAAMQIFPEVEPQGHTGMELTRVSAEVTDADVDGVVERVRKDNATYEAEQNRPAALGDQVLLDFAGSIDGAPFAGGTAQGHVLTLGSGQFIPGFEEQLVGCIAGESRDVKVTFPANYQADHLAGKEALFACTVQEVRRAILPEIDDRLAEAAGIKEGGLDRLTGEIRKSLEANVKKESERRIKKEVMDRLLAANPIELPSQLVARERESMVKQAKQEYSGKGIDVDKIGLSDDQVLATFERGAEDRVRLALVMNSIATKAEITVTEADLDAYVDRMVVQFGEQAEAMKQWFLGNRERLEGFRGVLMEEKLVAWIVSQGQVTEQVCPVDELTGQN